MYLIHTKWMTLHAESLAAKELSGIEATIK
ncbi:MAG: hypothetical protein RLZ42_1172, partial [Armatimonadota bacterium]